MQNHEPTPPAERTLIPVICDRCRTEGLAGQEHFAELGDLLDFTPVPRRKTRVDGWHAERQRAFVAALAVTGSKRRAAHAVGKAEYGVDQLFKSPGSESFRAACDAAMKIAREKGSRRLADGVSAVAGEAAAWSPAPAPWGRSRSRPPEPEPELTDQQRMEWLERIVRKYLMKVDQEREARVNGDIVAADFYVRQITWLEVLLDMMGTGGFNVLREFRKDDHHLIEIAETPMSRVFDDARRAHWAAQGDPPRPAPSPRHLLVDHGDYSTQPPECLQGGIGLSHEEQRRAFEEEHRRAAAEQLAWEAAARRDYERRRDSDAAS